MKFNLDDYLSSDSDSEESLSLSTSLEKTPSHESTKDLSLTLEPEVSKLIEQLNIDSDKLPYGINELGPLSIRHVVTEPAVTEEYLSEDDEAYSFTQNKQTLDLVNDTLQQRLKTISSRLKQRADSIRKEKARIAEAKRLEQERIKQEELKRKQAEEKAKREAEKKLLEEQRARETEAKKQAEAVKLKKEQEAKRQAEKEKLAKEQEAQKKQSAKYYTNWDSIEKTFWHYKQRIQSIKDEIVLPVKNAKKPIKSPIMTQKRKINPKFGQLTHSFQQLQLIQNELVVLINQARDASPIAFQWILNFVAKAIVHQSESEISVKPENALPLARLAIFLLNTYPELSDYLMSRLVKKCPFVIGFSCKIDTEQGRNNMGWKRNSEKVWETDTTYDERMSGMMTLYAVITSLNEVTLQDPEQNKLWNMNASWTLVARIANMSGDLLTNTHFVVLGSWWDACSMRFVQMYGNQGMKLLQLIANDMTNVVSERKYVGAARLRILYEEWQTSGKLDCFPEMTA